MIEDFLSAQIPLSNVFGITFIRFTSLKSLVKKNSENGEDDCTVCMVQQVIR